MAHSRTGWFGGKLIRTAVRGALAGGCLLCVLAAPGWSQSRQSSGSERPIVTAELPSINRGYDDVKYLFELAGDQKGYQTFKDTLDSFLEGVETDKPVGIRTYISEGKLHTVATLPVKTEADFHKFLKNLWDLDVKTAPPPMPALLPQVPRDIQAKAQSMKLHKDERIIFGLTDGFVRFEQGQVHLGRTIEDVRVARGAVSASVAHGASLAIHLDAGSESPAKRREAFEKSKEQVLEMPKREAFKTDADYELARAAIEYQLSKLELAFSESSRLDATWTTSREKKRWQLQGELSPAKDTSLAKDIERIGHASDEFAGVSKQGAVVWAELNVPVDSAVGKKLHALARQARDVSKDKIDKASNLRGEQKDNDKDFADFIGSIVEDVAGMEMFNGFARTWPAGEGQLTTVGAAKVPDGQKYRELVRKFHNQERAGKQGGGSGIEIHKVTLSKWAQDYPELFDKSGAVYIGTADKAVWYALGPGALERLEQAVQEAKGASPEKSDSAISLHAEMKPLADLWNMIRSRQPEDAARKVAKKSDEKGHKKISDTASTIADLKLHKVAAESFQEGNDTITLSLKRKGEQAELSAQFDEGVLRFAGKALSKFTKENLEE